MGHDLLWNSWMSVVFFQLVCILLLIEVTVVFWDIQMDVCFYQQQPQIILTWACCACGVWSYKHTNRCSHLTSLNSTHSRSMKSRWSLKWLELCWGVWLVVLSYMRFCSDAKQAAKCPLHPNCNCIQTWFTCDCRIKLLNNSLSKEVNFQIWYSWQCTVKLYSINLNVQTYKTVCPRN